MDKKDEKLKKPDSLDSAQFHSRSADYKAEEEKGIHIDKSYKNKKDYKKSDI